MTWTSPSRRPWNDIAGRSPPDGELGTTIDFEDGPGDVRGLRGDEPIGGIGLIPGSCPSPEWYAFSGALAALFGRRTLD